MRALRSVPRARHLALVEEPAIINCTGLGAQALFGDVDMMPARGQLTILSPQPEVDYVTFAPNHRYMFPRTDGVLLGGTFERGVATLAPDLATEELVLEDHRRFFDAIGHSDKRV